MGDAKRVLLVSIAETPFPLAVAGDMNDAQDTVRLQSFEAWSVTSSRKQSRMELRASKLNQSTV